MMKRQVQGNLREGAVQKCNLINKYLLCKNNDFFQNNYSQSWKSTMVAILRWRNLIYLFLGRTAVVKMSILSRIEDKVLNEWQKKIILYGPIKD